MEQRRPTPNRKKKTEGGRSTPRKPRISGASAKSRPESLLPVIEVRLTQLFPDAVERQAWVETLHPLFAMSPQEMIHSGREGQLLLHLDAWLREERDSVSL